MIVKTDCETDGAQTKHYFRLMRGGDTRGHCALALECVPCVLIIINVGLTAR